MGAPFDTGTWNGVTESMYNGAGWELIWLLVSIALCCFALWKGHSHETDAFKRADK